MRNNAILQYSWKSILCSSFLGGSQVCLCPMVYCWIVKEANRVFLQQGLKLISKSNFGLKDQTRTFGWTLKEHCPSVRSIHAWTTSVLHTTREFPLKDNPQVKSSASYPRCQRLMARSPLNFPGLFVDPRGRILCRVNPCPFQLRQLCKINLFWVCQKHLLSKCMHSREVNLYTLQHPMCAFIFQHSRHVS